MLKRICVAGLFMIGMVNVSLAQMSFNDESRQAGIDNLGSNHGISFGDFNNDGLEDVYVAVREEGRPNKLYINRGNLVFDEIAEEAGVDSRGSTTAAVWGDINNDGLLDLYVGNSDSPNLLYLNKGDLTFENITLTAEVGDPFDPRSVQFVDYDNDGFLDIYVHNFNTQNVLYKNNHDNTFSDVTMESGAVDLGPAMGTIFFDVDQDGDQDLFVLNDGTTNAFFINNGDGTFEDVSEASGLDTYCSCMGLDFGDMDHDGDYDIYITNYGVNFLFENNGDGTFTDRGEDLDVDDTGMGWGTFWFDFDNDGDEDIYLANHAFISPRPNMLYQNNGGQSFELISTNSNIESLYASFGTATADINNDGYLDFFVANWGNTARNQLFVNDHQENNSVLIKAVGTISNTSAIGTTIKVTAGGVTQIDQVTGAASYASQNSMVQHFGFGTTEIIDELVIIWPSGMEETYTNLPVNKIFTVTEDQGITNRDFERPVVLSTEPGQLIANRSFPNPFSNSTYIPVEATLGAGISVEIYSAEGNRVNVLSELSFSEVGTGFTWDGTNTAGARVNNGVYLYKVRGEGTGVLKTGKLILQR